MSESMATPVRPVGWKLWAGRILTAIPALMLLISGVIKIMRGPMVVSSFTNQFGYPASAVVPIGLIELTCVILYLIPRTTVLGAILVAGYFGGAIATHLRIGDPSLIGPLILGVMAWGGLYLREPRLHALLPLVKRA
jgi:hypothetical protein